MTEPNELAKWMTPDTSELRINRMWARLNEAETRRSGRRRWMFALAATAMIALVLGGVLLARPTTLSVGSELVAKSGPIEGRFADGSRVELAEAAAIELLRETPDELRVDLSRGAATFEVSKR